MQTINHHRSRFSLNRCLSKLRLKIPPPAYMLLFAGLMWWLNTQIPLATWMDSPWNRVGWLVMALSFIPAAGAFRLFMRVDTTADPFHPEQASTLVTRGVYAYTRNPMYLALLLLLIGWTIYLGSAIAILFPPLFVWVINTQQIKWEELALENVFQQEYLDYKQNVRRWL